MPRKRQQPDEYTISEPLTVTLRNGTSVTGTLWLRPSRRSTFEVEYDGRRASDYRTNYSGERHMRSMARLILREMAEDS
jgi:hypothetical protein